MTEPIHMSGEVGTGHGHANPNVIVIEPNVEALLCAIDGTWDSELERQLAVDLRAFDLLAVKDFKQPGSRFRADFFLPAPPYGIVELKVARNGLRTVEQAIAQASSRLQEVRVAFGESARAYIAVFQVGEEAEQGRLLTPDGVVVCMNAGMDTKRVAKRIADDFHAHSLRVPGRSGPPAAALLTDTDELTKPLSQQLFSLDWLMADAERKVVDHEFSHLRDEIGHAHFTAAALRASTKINRLSQRIGVCCMHEET